MKFNAVAYTPYIHRGKKKKGRPRTYGDKIALKSLYDDESAMEEILSPVYAGKYVTIRYTVHDLLWLRKQKKPFRFYFGLRVIYDSTVK